MSLIKDLMYKLHPSIGKLYTDHTVFFHDGIVGFIIGVPITFLLYYPIAPSLRLVFIIDWTIIFQFAWYIISAFISFCIQHYFRRSWVFKRKEKIQKIKRKKEKKK